MDKKLDEENTFGKEVLDAIKIQEDEEYLQEIRLKLVKGKGFIAAAQLIILNNPIFYDNKETWWLWNKTSCCWEEHDETDIINVCRKTLTLLGDTSVKHGSKLAEALRQIGRELNPKEPPLHYIQFNNEFYNINTKEIIPSTPAHFSTNTIPWHIGQNSDTPIMDELITSWVGEEYLQSVYEIIAYCTYRDYPIHRIFCFVGTGANGKTRLLKIIEKFIGEKNKSSVTLKKMSNNDFALYPLYRKLVSFVGETAHHKLESTELIKALTGQDPVSFEAKGHNAFTATNYAKLIVGTNVLPPSTDTSRGWFRRWYILEFPNEFQEGEDVVARIPDNEYENLAKKCVQILPELLKRGNFSLEGSIQERQEHYTKISNPIREFISQQYERELEATVRYTDVYLNYLSFLAKKKLRRISKKEFTSLLEDEGFETNKINVPDNAGGYKQVFMIYGMKSSTVSTNSTDPPVGSRFTPSSLGKYVSESSAGTIGTIPTTARLNDDYNSFFSKTSVLENIRVLGTPTYEELLSLFPGMDVEVMKWVQELKTSGDIFLIPGGRLKILE